MSYFKKHIFFCTNVKEKGKVCCGRGNADKLAQYAKAQLDLKELSGASGIRVTRSGCLGRCKLGPNLVVYPDGVWYSCHNEADIDEVIDTHLIGGQVVERLLHKESQA